MKAIFIHGLGQGPTNWDRTIDSLDGEYSIEVPDIFMMVEGETTYQKLYEGFSRFCDKIGGELCLCGLSIGAVLALNYTIDNPSKVANLILVGGQYKMPKKLLKLQNFLYGFMPDSCFSSMSISKSNIISLTKSMMTLDFSSRLKEIKARTLIICGGKDRVNMKATMEMGREIGNSTVKIIDGAGHEVNMDFPQALANAIEPYMSK